MKLCGSAIVSTRATVAVVFFFSPTHPVVGYVNFSVGVSYSLRGVSLILEVIKVFCVGYCRLRHWSQLCSTHSFRQSLEQPATDGSNH